MHAGSRWCARQCNVLYTELKICMNFMERKFYSCFFFLGRLRDRLKRCTYMLWKARILQRYQLKFQLMTRMMHVILYSSQLSLH